MKTEIVILIKNSKHRGVIIVLLCFFAAQSHAQQISNADLENWIQTAGVNVPDSFYTFDQIINVGTSFRTTDAFSGQYAVELKSRLLPSGFVFPGMLIYGTNKTIGTTNYSGGHYFPYRPRALSFWYKYSRSGSDTATVMISLFKGTSAEPVSVGMGKKLITENAVNYTYAEVPVEYSLSLTPDSVIIFWTCAEFESADSGTTLKIDCIRLEYTTDVKITGANDNAQYQLFQNHPNPCNPATTIRYAVPKTGHVQVAVYDIIGNRVVILVDEEKERGSYEVIFNASGLAGGVYFYRMQAGDFSDTKRLVLVK